MPASQTLTAPHPPAPLARLLAHYLEGHLTDPTWHRLRSVLDAPRTRPQARLALARFVDDVLDALGPGSIAEAVLAEATERLCSAAAAPAPGPALLLLQAPGARKRAA